MFSGLGLTAVSATETDTAKVSAFNYTNPDMYVADCLVKGNIDNEGTVTGDPLIYSALHHAYTYEYMAEALSDKDIDIIEGLKGMDCKENAHKYFKTYEKEVENVAQFKKEYAAIYTKLPKLEELQTPQEIG